MKRWVVFGNEKGTFLRKGGPILTCIHVCWPCGDDFPNVWWCMGPSLKTPASCGFIYRVPSGPTFPTFFRQSFLEDGYGSILTNKCVI